MLSVTWDMSFPWFGDMSFMAVLVQATPIGDDAATLTLWLAVLAVLTTLATEGVKQLPPHFTTWQKQLIAAIISGVLSGVTVAYEGRFDTLDWPRTWLIVFMGATTLYAVISGNAGKAANDALGRT